MRKDTERTAFANGLYNDFSHWLGRRFPFKVQKISIDAGFTCPNRDGSIGVGGCSYCDNRTFNPDYCHRGTTIREQLTAGKAFFARKYPDMKYLAYFQAYTNTYASVETLKRMYEEALGVEDVVGIVVGTRPDCMPDDLLNYLETLHRQTFMIVEYGIESLNDNTLVRINRGHDAACSLHAIERTAERGITTGAHVILGLPEEDFDEHIRQATLLSSTRLDVLKVHQMQIIKGTRLAREYAKQPFPVYSADEYIRLITEYIQYLRPTMVLERFVSQSPAHMLVAPNWGLKNHEFTHLLVRHLQKAEAWQGKRWRDDAAL